MTGNHAVHSDVLVIGGGLVGLAAAYALAREGASVTCVEAGQFGGHQSAQNWGFARQQGRGAAELALMRDANARWRRLSDELGHDIGWVEGGNLAVFDTPVQEAGYREWLTVGRAHGIDTRYVAPEEIPALVPGWKRSVRGAIYAREDGHADPHAVIRAYLEGCRREGVRLLAHTAATRLIRSGSRITGALTTDHAISAEKTVVATGAWSRQLLGTAGINLPQSYVIGTVSLTSRIRPLTEATVWGPGFSFRQRKDGRFVCAVGGGGLVKITADTVAQAPLFVSAFRKNWRRFTLRPSAHVFKELAALSKGPRAVREAGPPAPRVRHSEPARALRELRRTLSGTEDAVVEDSWSGVIDSTPDGLPVLDGAPGPEGLTVATGFSGHGYGLVPALGPVIADVVKGQQPEFDLTAFRLERFAKSNFKAPDAVL